MPGNLRDRLKRIQGTRQGGFSAAAGRSAAVDAYPAALAAAGWMHAGHFTLRTEITAARRIIVPATVPAAAGIVMPGMESAAGALPEYTDLLFFDLETTGLSHGAGTVAFLAAFGRLENPVRSAYELRITQYLLLDYPGENDFVAAIIAELTRAPKTVVVSYNGKSFDSPLFSTRCLMNGFNPPAYRHADLLHPARRLWKRLLPDCSQASIESGILGIDRQGDIPGALAPEIWFSFLKTGETDALAAIADHNRRDCVGLASLFAALAGIARDPLAAARKIRFDMGALALRWHDHTHRFRRLRGNDSPLSETGQKLLRAAAARGHQRAAVAYAQTLLRRGQYEAGREQLMAVAAATADADSRLVTAQTAALRALAIDSERRLKDIPGAIALSEWALRIVPPDSSPHRAFQRRLQRLTLKKR